MSTRHWEIDFLRGIAVICMLIYHWLVDLKLLGLKYTSLDSGFWGWFQRGTAGLFLLLVGISLVISNLHSNQTGSAGSGCFCKTLRRGVTIFIWGILISIITRIFLNQGYVIFGILHLIGISIILAYPLIRFRFPNLGLGLLIILFGAYLEQYRFATPAFIWLGFTPKSFYSVDYFPLLPWFGMVLIGIFLGKILYHNRQQSLKPLNSPVFRHAVQGCCYLGRHSLIIYLIHQPLLLLLLSLYKLT